ncbi:DUF58 domain-containing protein [Egicoccus halophilus]|uniref:DUF58 domain-containing protein n=1 Tax=Egicoccus halophilus TaxID=1670830 RepID=A0A8J3ESU4_9ACTN|nr:DUF58 domain-containing protein [Egicoccus halophilus]GGI08172.1 hypothetical protein GCM10011354_27760 [Egicoccus halophilus]
MSARAPAASDAPGGGVSGAGNRARDPAAGGSTDEVAPAPWRVVGNAVPRLVAGGALLLLGLLINRGDVAVLGVVLVAPVVVDVLRGPRGRPEIRLDGPAFAPALRRATSALVIDPPAGTGTLLLRVGAAEHRDLEVLIDGGGRRTLTLALTTVRTGRQALFGVDHRARGRYAAVGSPAERAGPVSLLVLPQPVPLQQVPLPHRLQGLTGSHRSARAGDGGEFRDLAVFTAGDRLRRIDWKATARRGTGPAPATTGAGVSPEARTTQLYVRRTFATSDAHVMLVVDARDALGPDVSTWAVGGVHPLEPTSLDLARQAAISLASHFLDLGDRVGVVELGRRQRPLRPAGGRRQLRKLAHHVALAQAERDPSASAPDPQLPAGVLVMVLSTFLDDRAVELARTWRFAGHRTIAVDVLPRTVREHLAAREVLAHRLVAMERADRLRTLGAAGVEVVEWRDPDAGRVAGAQLAARSRVRRSGR